VTFCFAVRATWLTTVRVWGRYTGGWTVLGIAFSPFLSFYHDHHLNTCHHTPSQALWDPVLPHTYTNCNRRNEPLHGGRLKLRLFVKWENGVVEVCKKFWCNTFGIGGRSFARLDSFSTQAFLPPNAFAWGGSVKSAKESLVREYVGTIPRHFSHYSMSSTSEYVDCASSALNWWKGPTETNDDGTVSIPFLEWLVKRNGTEDLPFYNEHAYFPGVHSLTSRPNLPHTLVGPGALPIPVPAVAYHYFLSMVKAFDPST